MVGVVEVIGCLEYLGSRRVVYRGFVALSSWDLEVAELFFEERVEDVEL